MRRLVLAFLLLAAPAVAAPDVTGLGFDQRQGAALPADTQLTEVDGRMVALGSLFGRPMVLQFGYFTCPNLCGIARDDALAALAATGLVAGQDYDLLYVSIDPAETSAQAAAALAGSRQRNAAPGAAVGWHFLTGPSAALQDAAGFRARYDGKLQQFLHPAGVVFATPAGAVSSYLPGVGYTPADVRAGVLRARDGGYAAASPVLLLCLHFDPSTGRYTLAVTKLLRLAAGLSVAVLGLALLLAHRPGRPV